MAVRAGKTAWFAAFVAACAVLLACATPAFAKDVDQLSAAYVNALQGYEDALDDQEQNASEISALDAEIRRTEGLRDKVQAELGKVASDLYKDTRGGRPLLNLMLESATFDEAVSRLDTYERVQSHLGGQVNGLIVELNELDARHDELVQRKQELESQVESARQEAEEAHQALIDAMHLDGADYHQLQGNGENCGATSFIVGVNVLLHENRFTDNVAVWAGPGFGGDSTADITYKGRMWLLANGMSDVIGVEDVPGDVHAPEELAELLSQGKVVVISSGPGSVWQRADGTETAPTEFPDGHYVVFYRYDEEAGIFYCNDSSVDAGKGAGCPYTEAQMRQWLDGRGNHFAVAMYTLD